MFKCILQEFCRKNGWELPEYTTFKEGPGHMPRFTAVVKVYGKIFETLDNCKSGEEAENTAAQIAMQYLTSLPLPPPPASLFIPGHSQPIIHPLAPLNWDMALPLSPLPSSLPIPPPALLKPRDKAISQSALPPNLEDGSDGSGVHRMSIGSFDKIWKDTLHVYKNRLQQYAQKHNLDSPVYSTVTEGPPHARRFRSRVSLNGKSYETIEFFPSLKEAQHIAAKIACHMLLRDEIQEDTGLYKSLLNEFAQKQGLRCPLYDTVSTGLPHMPLFVSTVEIEKKTFTGTACKTKKQAERNAAKVAYCALT